MLGGAVVERCALTHQPPHVLPLSQPVRRVGSFPRGGEWTACAVVWWLSAHTHQPPSHMLGGAVVERYALAHQPPHVFLLSQPVRRVGSFPRGGEWTTCAVVCRPLAHTHQPSSRVEGGAVVEHVALTHQPPSEPLLLPLLSRRGPVRRSRLRTRRRGRLPMRPGQRRLFRCRSQSPRPGGALGYDGALRL